jgi:hypothetical protein
MFPPLLTAPPPLNMTCFIFQTGSHYVAQAGLKLVILSPSRAGIAGVLLYLVNNVFCLVGWFFVLFCILAVLGF